MIVLRTVPAPGAAGSGGRATCHRVMTIRILRAATSRRGIAPGVSAADSSTRRYRTTTSKVASGNGKLCYNG